MDCYVQQAQFQETNPSKPGLIATCGTLTQVKAQRCLALVGFGSTEQRDRESHELFEEHDYWFCLAVEDGMSFQGVPSSE